MAVLAEPTAEGVDDRLAKHNTLVLAVAQALAGANAGVIVATGGIAGAILAPDPALATLPISVMAVGMWAGTLPVGMLATVTAILSRWASLEARMIASSCGR
jgi:hypothetical protein